MRRPGVVRRRAYVGPIAAGRASTAKTASLPCAIRGPTAQARAQVWLRAVLRACLVAQLRPQNRRRFALVKGQKTAAQSGLAPVTSVPRRPVPTRAARFVARVAVLQGRDWASRAA
jgi:hypothetical protein